ncbi:hypothetical protein EMPG_12563 [Blastomyces silverae]|uniref:Uncharacterized protein n=1 Tax=Blastomyces silverae TaxID=2060906 RepID=A0A0H1BN21_9EURO|nr:hypothetical protein EMPG_12563 [Blastomyces silverae]
MCNGFSSRTSQGGATAFLRPLDTEADETASNNALFDYQITLREHRTAEREAIHFYINRPTGEQAEQTQLQPCPVETFRAYWVEIQYVLIPRRTPAPPPFPAPESNAAGRSRDLAHSSSQHETPHWPEEDWWQLDGTEVAA